MECIQDNIKMYLFSIKAKELIDNSHIDFYDAEREEGYQRQLYPPHYRKIANYILENDNGLLPTAIIAAIDPKEIVVNNESLILETSFRIVDGQHRCEALKYIKKIESEIFQNRVFEMDFPIVLMIIDRNNKNEYINEIRTFIDINKKGRKVSTDLAYSLLKRIIEKRISSGETITDSELYELIATNVTKKINENEKCCWYRKIKMGGSDDNGKPVSQNAFIKSLLPLIKSYYSRNYVLDEIESMKIQDNVDDCVNYIEAIVKDAWSVIGDKWVDCFFWDEYYECFRYDNYYNIQKGLGVYPLHNILNDAYINNSQDTISELDRYFKLTKIDENSWEVGGAFSKLNSKAGFDQIKNYLLEKSNNDSRNK